MGKLTGFALLSPEARRAMASEAGKKAHRTGAAHTWTSDEAALAGRKGGETAAKRRRAAIQPTDTKEQQT